MHTSTPSQRRRTPSPRPPSSSTDDSGATRRHRHSPSPPATHALPAAATAPTASDGGGPRQAPKVSLVRHPPLFFYSSGGNHNRWGRSGLSKTRSGASFARSGTTTMAWPRSARGPCSLLPLWWLHGQGELIQPCRHGYNISYARSGSWAFVDAVPPLGWPRFILHRWRPWRRCCCA